MDKIIAIAIDEYSNAPEKNLNNCLNDINSIVNILNTEYEYDPKESEITLYNKPEQTTLSYLYKSLNEEFYNSLETDRILLIFAGHGEYNPHLKTGYWVCSDSNFDDPTSWFNLNILISFFSASKAKNIALISDSCFSGSIFQLTRGGGPNALNKNSRQALTSGGLEKVSDGNENDNSPFNKAIQLTLMENEQEDLSFTAFCETTIKHFPATRKQTPAYGSLNIDGDAGGTYIFKKKLKPISNDIFHKNILLPPEIDKRIKINSNINIPFFYGNTDIDLNFINHFLQQLGYKIINEIRVFTYSDIERLIEINSKYEFEVEAHYEIHRLDKDFLSISLSHTDDFASIHPNHYMYSINFRLNPTMKVNLFDVFEINYIEGISNLISNFAEEDCKEIILEQLESIDLYDLDFSFNDSSLFLYFTNHLPHAYTPCSFVVIPLDQVIFKELV